jgi:hypothetical protein
MIGATCDICWAAVQTISQLANHEHFPTALFSPANEISVTTPMWSSS